jgi:endonuclease/exonuclease/phosphatase family metal-dependent hydrolase
MLKKRERPYHIDYCFIPEPWVPSITSVEVGAYETWITASDHCPLVVDIALPRTF